MQRGYPMSELNINREVDPAQHYKTKNAKGFMHPITQLGREFISFSKTATPVIDMGCAYGNTVMAVLDAGVGHIIACDMEEGHLAVLSDQLDEPEKQRVTLKQGVLPHGFDFAADSIAGIHVSLVLPYLNEQELDEALSHFYQWLKPNGKLFILCYSIFIKELVNPYFEAEYKKRCAAGREWPGYLDDFSKYSYTDDVLNEQDTSAFPMALHFFDKEVLVKALQALGFIIECAEYLDGPANGAVEETWYDGREFIAVIARKSVK